MTIESDIREQIQESIRLKTYLQENINVLMVIANEIINSLRKGNKIVVFGNGGSAADAQHIAAELAGRFQIDRNPLPAIALTTDSSVITAIANDYSFEQVFARQVRGLVTEGDVALGISTSGESLNVIRGIEEAKQQGATTIALVGQGGRLASIAQYVLEIPSKHTARIQEVHITAVHVICYLVEQAIFGQES